MKSYIILILVLFSTIIGITQENKVKMSLNISNTLMNGIKRLGLRFDLTTIGLGIDIRGANANFRLYATYGFNTLADNRNLSYKSHSLGLIFECYFLNNDKRFRPFIGVGATSEIATNYKDGYLDYDDLYFTARPYFSKYGQGPGGGPYYYMPYKTRSYQSMPLVGLFYVGCSIKIVENLNVNLSLGYNLSLINYKYVQWSYSGYKEPDESIVKEDYYNSLKTAFVQTGILHTLAVQLGLNYAFSFKKKEK